MHFRAGLKRLAVLALGGLVGGCNGTDLDALVRREQPPPPQHTTTQLLQYGGGTPHGLEGLSWLSDHLPEVEAAPFDGLMLDIDFGAWPYEALVEANYAAQVSVLTSAQFTRLSSNFQVVTMGTVNWQDDAEFERLLANVGVIARVARAAGLRGIFLDTQAYASYFWNAETACQGQPDLASCEDKLKQRGQAFMHAWIDGYPDITVLVSLAYAEVFVTTCLLGTPLEASNFAVLPAFLDGMETARAESRTSASLVDAFLPAYATRDPNAFRLYYDLIHFNWTSAVDHWIPGVTTYEWVPGVTNQSVGEQHWPDRASINCSMQDQIKLTRDLPVSFGLDLDWDVWNRGGQFSTDPAEFSRNFRTPDQLEAQVRTALATADRYVWIWGAVDWWTPQADEGRARVPDAYVLALARANRH